MRVRRSSLMLAVAVSLVSATGASCPHVLRQYTESPPPALPSTPTLADLFRVVNENSALVRSLYTTNASIRVHGMPAIGASLALERDRRFRLKGETALTGPVVDLGSNDELFWFWMRRSQSPVLFYCRHNQFAASAASQLMPVEPEWLIDALGIPLFGSTDQHSGPVVLGDGRLEIRSQCPTALGPVTKVTILEPTHGWVLEQHVYDVNGRLVASALASRHRRDPLTGATLPRHVEIHWPRQQFTLGIDLGSLQANYLPDDAEQLWVLPDYAGSEWVDLADPNIRIEPSRLAAPPSALDTTRPVEE